MRSVGKFSGFSTLGGAQSLSELLARGCEMKTLPKLFWRKFLDGLPFDLEIVDLLYSYLTIFQYAVIKTSQFENGIINNQKFSKNLNF